MIPDIEPDPETESDRPRVPIRKPLFGDDQLTESAGSELMYNLLPDEVAATIFDDLLREIPWRHMHHQTGEVPRLVCCQASLGPDDGGGTPIYRHPSDQTVLAIPWTPAVDTVRCAAEHVVGHRLNHALIQLYRSGTDYISEHSDKTLDIVPASTIVNVSFGAQRTMRMRTKRAAAVSPHPRHPDANPSPPSPPRVGVAAAAAAPRTTYRVPMPHNSLLAMTLATNAQFLHGISADKRRAVERSAAEAAFGGQRISLTFRCIGTFLSPDALTIWGQGAKGKSRDAARPVVSGDAAESAKLIYAFGAENQASAIQWAEIYGEGSDVLHLK